MKESHAGSNETRDRRGRIEALKERARALSGGQMMGFVSPLCSPEVEEAFWTQVVSVEERAQGLARTHVRSLAQELTRSSVELVPADRMNDQEVKEKLWEVIQALAERRYFLLSTDHLSDRQLYQRLCSQELLEDYLPLNDPRSARVLDCIGSGSEQDIHDYLKYYADWKARRGWRKEFPEETIPPHEDPSHDRDRFLPRAPWEQPEDGPSMAWN